MCLIGVAGGTISPIGRWSRSQGGASSLSSSLTCRNMGGPTRSETLSRAGRPRRASPFSPPTSTPRTAMRALPPRRATASGRGRPVGEQNRHDDLDDHRGAESNATRLGAVGYTFTRSPDAADLWMASMTSWRRTASAKSGTVRVPLSMSAANAA